MPHQTVGQEPAASYRLSDVFCESCVEVLSPDQHKTSVLTTLVTTLARAGQVEFDRTGDVVRALVAREGMGTTALGNGLAFPHTRTSAVRRSVGAIGAAPGGVDFASLDGEPTRLVFLLLSPQDGTAGHLKILQQISELMSDRALRRSLDIERTPAALLSFLGVTDDESDGE
jgi:PTS system fructose-specific IIC component